MNKVTVFFLISSFFLSTHIPEIPDLVKISEVCIYAVIECIFPATLWFYYGY